MYHSVAGAGPSGRYAVPVSRFAAQMAWLRRMGWQGVGVGAGLRDGLAKHPRVVALSFDDGYADFVENAFPVLASHGFGATVFLPTAYVGRSSEWEAAEARPLLTWAQAAELAAAGIELGSHTASHLDLRYASEQAAREELLQSRRAIEQHTGAEVVSFAYPYGVYSPEVPRLLRETGYQHALLAATYGSNTPATPPYELRRVPIWGSDGLGQFAAKVSGWYWWRYYTIRAAQEARWALRWRGGRQRAGG